jgi:hypothetical protein
MKGAAAGESTGSPVPAYLAPFGRASRVERVLAEALEARSVGMAGGFR